MSDEQITLSETTQQLFIKLRSKTESEHGFDPDFQQELYDALFQLEEKKFSADSMQTFSDTIDNTVSNQELLEKFVGSTNELAKYNGKDTNAKELLKDLSRFTQDDAYDVELRLNIMSSLRVRENIGLSYEHFTHIVDEFGMDSSYMFWVIPRVGGFSSKHPSDEDYSPFKLKEIGDIIDTFERKDALNILHSISFKADAAYKGTVRDFAKVTLKFSDDEKTRKNIMMELSRVYSAHSGKNQKKLMGIALNYENVEELQSVLRTINSVVTKSKKHTNLFINGLKEYDSSFATVAGHMAHKISSNHLTELYMKTVVTKEVIDFGIDILTEEEDNITSEQSPSKYFSFINALNEVFDRVSGWAISNTYSGDRKKQIGNIVNQHIQDRFFKIAKSYQDSVDFVPVFNTIYGFANRSSGTYGTYDCYLDEMNSLFNFIEKNQDKPELLEVVTPLLERKYMPTRIKDHLEEKVPA